MCALDSLHSYLSLHLEHLSQKASVRNKYETSICYFQSFISLRYRRHDVFVFYNEQVVLFFSMATSGLKPLTAAIPAVSLTKLATAGRFN